MQNPLPLLKFYEDEKKTAISTTKLCDSAVDDIDEEIRRLENELAAQSSSTEEEEEEESSVEEKAIVCLSTVAKDRIEPLPAVQLPSNKRRRLKIDATEGGQPQQEGDRKQTKKSKYKVQNKDEKPSLDMLAAVKEMIAGYVARSSERIPFYCRVCQVQSEDERHFHMHRKTELHKLAVKEEQKASFCKVCRKQFTSVVQLKEHLSSKPHRDRMDFVQANQPQKGNRRWRNNQNPHHDHQDSRQWC